MTDPEVVRVELDATLVLEFSTGSAVVEIGGNEIGVGPDQWSRIEEDESDARIRGHGEFAGTDIPEQMRREREAARGGRECVGEGDE